MDIGDRAKFKTMGGWYNSGIIRDMDEDSYLIEVDEFGYNISLPYYVKVSYCETVNDSEDEEGVNDRLI